MNNNQIIMGLGAVVVVVVLGGFFFMNSQSNSDTETATLPTSNDPATSYMADEDGEAMVDQTIVDIAVNNEDFSTLVAAVTEAGLVETLSGEGPFTVFAPTNAAFEALGEETLNAVLADKDQLTSILTYHVVAGKVMAADVVELSSATTVQGSDVAISVEGGDVMINEAKVIMTDIEASNGVIHVIDAVLVPTE